MGQFIKRWGITEDYILPNNIQRRKMTGYRQRDPAFLGKLEQNTKPGAGIDSSRMKETFYRQEKTG